MFLRGTGSDFCAVQFRCVDDITASLIHLGVGGMWIAFGFLGVCICV